MRLERQLEEAEARLSPPVKERTSLSPLEELSSPSVASPGADSPPAIAAVARAKRLAKQKSKRTTYEF